MALRQSSNPLRIIWLSAAIKRFAAVSLRKRFLAKSPLPAFAAAEGPDFLLRASGVSRPRFRQTAATSSAMPAKTSRAVSKIGSFWKAAGQTLPTYTEPAVASGVTIPRATHLNELRIAVDALSP